MSLYITHPLHPCSILTSHSSVHNTMSKSLTPLPDHSVHRANCSLRPWEMYMARTSNGDYFVRYLGARSTQYGFRHCFVSACAQTVREATHVAFVELICVEKTPYTSAIYRALGDGGTGELEAALTSSGTVTFHGVLSPLPDYRDSQMYKTRAAGRAIYWALKGRVVRRQEAARLITSTAKAAAANPFTRLGRRVLLRRAGFVHEADAA